MRSGSRLARAVVQARIALGPPAPNPLVGRGPGDAHLVSDVGDGTAGSDPVDQESAAVNGQLGVGVRHGHVFSR